MKTKKIIKMGWLMGLMIVLCLADVFAATRAYELYQKAVSEIKQQNTEAAIPLLDAVLACDDANDILRMNSHRHRARLIYFENPESAKSDCNLAIMTAKNIIAERLNGNGLPDAPLAARFGQDLAGFMAAGRKLRAETRPAGDAALALRVFPGLTVEVILWRADEEFPAQVSFTLPAHLDRFWFLDAVWGLLNLVTQELIKAAPEAAT